MIVKESLETLIEPIVTSMGCELWGVEYHTHGRAVLKVYIDSTGGIDIGDCERISRQLSAMLDVEDPVAGEYILEVSSPGMDRRLFRFAQYDAFVGSQIKITLKTPFEGRRKFSGLLCGTEDGDVVIRVDEEEYLLPFEDIERARIVPQF